MFQFFTNINVDWMGIRKPLIALSVLILLAGLISAVGRQLTPGGTSAFNLGVDFQGGTFITAKFKNQKPSEDEIRTALQNVGVNESVIQSSTDKQDEMLIKVPLIKADPQNQANADQAENANAQTVPESENSVQNSEVSAGRNKVREALNTFGKEAEGTTSLTDDEAAGYKIVGTANPRIGPEPYI